MKKAIWCVLMVALLGLALSFQVLEPTGDAEVLLLYGLMTINFPLGIAPVFIANVVIRAMTWQPGTGLLLIIMEWAVVGLFGYFQWFIIMPKLIARVKKKWGGDQGIYRQFPPPSPTSFTARELINRWLG